MDEKKHIASTPLCEAWGRTGIGGRKENQDSYGGIVVGNNTMLTVCDGMGGMAGGQTASITAVTEIVNAFAKYKNECTIEDLIGQSINNANKAIYAKALQEPTLRGMGTTATILVIAPDAAYLTHVGDSRIYKLHNGKKIFRTFDHSKVFEMVAQGYMTEEQARQSNFSNIISRALGIRNTVEFTVQKIPYRKGDRFLLCCDGIWNILPEKKMLPLFSAQPNAEDNIVTLTDFVDKYGIEHGNNHDNLTAIMADIKVDSIFQYSVWHYIVKAFKNIVKKLKFKKIRKY